jgi:tetratricopeptide (TPR) repeat protein
VELCTGRSAEVSVTHFQVNSRSSPFKFVIIFLRFLFRVFAELKGLCTVEDTKGENESGTIASQELKELLGKFKLRNELSRELLDKALEHQDIIKLLSEYKGLLNDYQSIYKTMDPAELSTLNSLCQALNKKAMSDEECKFYFAGKAVVQKASSFDELFEQAKRALEKFPSLLVHIAGVSSNNSKQSIHSRNVLEEISKLLPNSEVSAKDVKNVLSYLKQVDRAVTVSSNQLPENISIGPLKDVKRSVEKIVREYDGDFNRLIDLVRASIVFDKTDDLVKFLERISEEKQGDVPFQVVRVKNGFTDSLTTGGYRDIKLNVAFDGHVCEIQIHLKKFFSLKNQRGHDLYDKIRVLKVAGALNAADFIVGLPPDFLESLDCILQMEYASAKMKEASKLKTALSQKELDLVSNTISARINRVRNGAVPDPISEIKNIVHEYFKLSSFSNPESKEEFSLDHPLFQNADFLDILNDLATSYSAKAYFELAAGYFAIVLSKKESMYGYKHPSFLSTRRGYSHLMQSCGVKKEVIRAYLQGTVECYRTILGDKSFETLRCLADYATFLEPPEALEEHKKILFLKKSMLGDSFHLEIANSHRDISNVYAEMKDNDSSLRHLQQCFEIEKECLGERNLRTASTKLALIFEEQLNGDPDELIQKLKEGNRVALFQLISRRFHLEKNIDQSRKIVRMLRDICRKSLEDKDGFAKTIRYVFIPGSSNRLSWWVVSLWNSGILNVEDPELKITVHADVLELVMYLTGWWTYAQVASFKQVYFSFVWEVIKKYVDILMSKPTSENHWEQLLRAIFSGLNGLPFEDLFQDGVDWKTPTKEILLPSYNVFLSEMSRPTEGVPDWFARMMTGRDAKDWETRLQNPDD